MTTLMLGLSGLLALIGALLFGMVVIGAFKDSMKEGMMSILIPGYVLYFGWKKMNKPWIPAAGLAALLGAGVVGFFSSSFEPNLTIDDDSAFEEDGAFGDDDAFGDDSFDDLDEPLD